MVSAQHIIPPTVVKTHTSEQDTKHEKAKRRLPEKAKPFMWKKGQSGNPGGRPKKDLASEVAVAIFEGNPDAIYRAMLKALKKGNPKVYTALADRAFGKLTEKFEVADSATLIERLNAGRKRVRANV